MTKIARAISCFAVLFAGDAALAQERAATTVASAQFPAARSAKTEEEWWRFNIEYMRRYIPYLVDEKIPMHAGFGLSGAAPNAAAQTYSEFDEAGRPMWWGGARDYQLRNLVQTLLSNDMFAELDRLIDDWTRNAERTADGKWKLIQFTDQLDNNFAWENGWRQELERIKRWKAKNPRSVGAALAEAEYWRSYAWHARGEGYANTVDKDAWTLFFERSKKAEEALLASKAYAGDNPLWANIYLNATAGLDWSHQETLDFFREQAAKHKYFYDLYFTMVNYASPKWGGSWELIDEIARNAEAETKEIEGATMYARVYWSAFGANRDHNVFEESRVDWAHMKQGFADMNARYPHSARNMNALAHFACWAGDAEAFRAARWRMGDSVETGIWPSERPLDLCEHKFPLHKTERAPMWIKAAFK